MDYSQYKINKKRKYIKFSLLALLTLFIVLIIYGVYILASYKRIPDMYELEVYTTGDANAFMNSDVLDTDRAYNFMTFNIGYGANIPSYNFFMDGGVDSTAKSDESVMANSYEISNVIMRTAPDFLLLQEVDIDGTRSHHVNELELISSTIGDYYYNYAINYDSAFLLYPLNDPYGANESCIATYSTVRMEEAVRRSLPVASDLSRFTDLDRCYSVTKIETDKGNYLCIYNVHISAYTEDTSIRDGQINMLFSDMEKEYLNGNYVVCGGDFNHNLKSEPVDNMNLPWAKDFPRDRLPAGFRLAVDSAYDNYVEHNTCRSTDRPYGPDSFTVTVDGFIVSDNVNVNFYTNSIWNYKYSDHDPVIMQVIFK